MGSFELSGAGVVFSERPEVKGERKKHRKLKRKVFSFSLAALGFLL
jgi:hypothetical protein